MENCAVLFGSNMYVGGADKILRVEIDGKIKDIIEIKEIYRARSEGSYLTVYCDIKDNDNVREIKLAKSRPVVIGDEIGVKYEKQMTHITRKDGSTVIKVEQLESDDPSLPQTGPVSIALKKEKLDAIIRVTGDFYAGPHKFNVDNSNLRVGRKTIGGNLSYRPGGIILNSMGWGWG